MNVSFVAKLGSTRGVCWGRKEGVWRCEINKNRGRFDTSTYLSLYMNSALVSFTVWSQAANKICLSRLLYLLSSDALRDASRVIYQSLLPPQRHFHSWGNQVSACMFMLANNQCWIFSYIQSNYIYFRFVLSHTILPRAKAFFSNLRIPVPLQQGIRLSHFSCEHARNNLVPVPKTQESTSPRNGSLTPGPGLTA